MEVKAFVLHIAHRLNGVAVTGGTKGPKTNSGDGVVEIPAVPEIRLVDPTGVGDAYRGGFLKGYLRGLPLGRCAQIGALAATYCLEHEGPQGHEYSLATFLERFRIHFPDGPELDQLW